MKDEEKLMMRREDLKRIRVIGEIIEKKVGQVTAAKLLGISVRQIRRIVRQVREEGAKGVLHRLLGKASNNRYSGKVKERVLNLYMDRHTTYQGNGGATIAEELMGRDKSLSQFGRALEELGVGLIPAGSPQAKGRVERLFRTFQDRVIKEMRLAGVRNKEEGNEFLEEYLPKFNRRFERKAKEEGDVHRVVTRKTKLEQALSIQTEHVVRNDNTIRHENRYYQIVTRWNGNRPKRVIVEERLNGKRYVTWRGRELSYREIEKRPKVIEIAKKSLGRVQKSGDSTPKKSHPWRKGYQGMLTMMEPLSYAA